MNPTDAAQLRDALLKPAKARPTNRPETVSRYSKLKPLLAPMVRDGRTLQEIADRLSRLRILTPNGRSRWWPVQSWRAIRASGLYPEYEKRMSERWGSGLKSPTGGPDA